MPKSFGEINEKIGRGKAVVLTAEELIGLVSEKGVGAAAREVDVVTTGTFGPMCSSGALLNIGRSRPGIKLGGGRVRLNGVPACAALAAADVYMGATALPEDDPRNRRRPGEFRYGGGHVIEDLVAGKEILLEAEAYGTDCYPRTHLSKRITLSGLADAWLLNPRNAYQNYNCAVNLSGRMIYTYMGVLKPKLGNANYCSAGQLSPLLKDPSFRTVGIGTRIFLGGTEGYVIWQGTQHNPDVPRTDGGAPRGPGGTIAVIGDLKDMSGRYVMGVSLLGYGASLAVGIGIPIPVLDEEICAGAALADGDLVCPVVDYGAAYPEGRPESIAEVTYAELRSGKAKIMGKEVPTASLSSYPRAREIAETLKGWILEGRFTLTEPVAPLPGADCTL